VMSLVLFFYDAEVVTSNIGSAVIVHKLKVSKCKCTSAVKVRLSVSSSHGSIRTFSFM
jgi:hypothetical protein